MLNSPLRFLDPSGHFSEDAIRSYISQGCEGDEVCIEQRMSGWSSNEQLWNMLLEAQAGDILFVGIHDGFFAFGEFYKFTGEGQDILTGISRSSIFGYSPTSDHSAYVNDAYLDDLRIENLFMGQIFTESGEKGIDWGGYIRWTSLIDDGAAYTYPLIKSHYPTEYGDNVWLSRIFQWLTGLVPKIGFLLSSEGSDLLGIGSRTMNVNLGDTHLFTFEIHNDGFDAGWEFKGGAYFYYPDPNEYPTIYDMHGTYQ